MFKEILISLSGLNQGFNVMFKQLKIIPRNFESLDKLPLGRKAILTLLVQTQSRDNIEPQVIRCLP